MEEYWYKHLWGIFKQWPKMEDLEKVDLHNVAMYKCIQSKDNEDKKITLNYDNKINMVNN